MKSVKTFIQERQKKYVEGWQNDSNYISVNGLYEWMVSQLKGEYKHVLEIGCGVGKSTLELLKSGRKIISIDENYYCIEQTHKLLLNMGFRVLKINDRLDRKLTGNFYRSEPKTKKLPEAVNVFENYDCILVQSDILNDLELIHFCKTIELNAVVCWLIGTHSAKFFDANLDNQVRTPLEYRFKVQNTIYTVADELLQIGGVLNIIDRGIHLDEYNQKILIQSHMEQAEGTNLNVVDQVSQVELGVLPENGVGVVRQETHEANVEITKQRLWLHSVNSFK